MSYRPEQQSLPARIFTTAGWVTGHVMAPKGRLWLEHINSCGHWLKLTDARLPSDPEPTSFFALARTAAIIFEPTAGIDASQLANAPVDATDQQVSCLLDIGVVVGTVGLRPNIRVSDFLAQKAEFMHLKDVQVRLFGRHGEATLEMAMADCFMNATKVVGISELD